MADFTKRVDDASIIAVGNFNPSIFHPEWMIRKGIVPEWEYGKPNNLPDLSQFTLPTNKQVEVYLNRFLIRSQTPSEHLEIRDIASGIFTCLCETPIDQLGMNYSRVYQMSESFWRQFGQSFAPRAPWSSIADYLDQPDLEDAENFGMIDLMYQLPRPDELGGYLRPRIRAVNVVQRTVELSVNSHVNIQEKSAAEAVKTLAEHWENTLSISGEIIDNILAKHAEVA